MRILLRSLPILMMTAALLAACSSAASPTAIPTVMLGGGNSAGASPSSSGVAASGEVVPEPKAALSFPLTGTVKSVEVEPGDQVSKGDVLTTLDPALWDARVQEAQGTLAAAEAEERLLVRNGADQEHIDAANADVDRAQAALDAAEATLQQATLTAPFDGTIAAVEIAAAETVTPGQVVIQIGDLANFQVVTTDLSERDVPLVEAGQKATISIPALGQEYTGQVLEVSRLASTVGGDVVYEVTLSFDEQPLGLLWGMSAEVRIAVSE